MGPPPTAAVAAGSRHTTDAAAQLLENGGNAVDAAIGAAFAATVCEPGLASLGGGGFLLADDGTDPVVYDFFVNAPGRGGTPATPEAMDRVVIGFAATEQVFYAGRASVAVPGALDGLVQAHHDLGRLPLRDVVAPARRLAADGFVLEPMQEVVLRLLTRILSLTKECGRTYLPDGRRPRAGDTLRNTALADVLDGIGSGQIASFRDLPGIAEVLEEMAEHAGGLTADDLAEYRVFRRQPLVVPHDGAQLLTNPEPALGGPILARAIELLNAQGPADTGPDGSARLVTALRQATEEEKSAHHAGTLIARRGTTHVSVVDGEGMLASLTQSNGSSSGVMVPGSGVQLNNVMGEEDLHPAGLDQAVAGRRIASMMAPTVLRLGDGSRVAMGSGGSERIRTALLTVAIGLTDRGQDLTEAVNQSRLHWDGHIIQAEPGLSQSVLARLRGVAPVAEWAEPDLYFGGAHVVQRAPDGTARGIGDRRRGGVARVVAIED